MLYGCVGLRCVQLVPADMRLRISISGFRFPEYESRFSQPIFQYGWKMQHFHTDCIAGTEVD
jgi:hypothetical protein